MLNITMSRLSVKSCKTLEKIGLPGASENDLKQIKNIIDSYNTWFSFIFTVSWRIRKGTSGSTLVRRTNQYEWPKAAKDRLRNISFLLYIPILGKEIRHLSLRSWFFHTRKSQTTFRTSFSIQRLYSLDYNWNWHNLIFSRLLHWDHK